jgi:REP element-mobilizing transposase RayT
MHAYLAGICKNLEAPSLIVGGVEDHVHLLCRFSKNITLANFLRELKRDSSKWVKTQAPDLVAFHWQAGYGAFSISPSHVNLLKQYIANQEEHHRKETFQDEFRRLCRKYGVAIDERYVWD